MFCPQKRAIFPKESHFILCIVCMWPLFCSVQGYISLYFLPLWICNFPLSLYNKSPFFVRLITQSHSILLILLFNLFLFSLHKIWSFPQAITHDNMQTTWHYLKVSVEVGTDNFTPCLIISKRFVHVFWNRFLQDNMMFSTRKTSSTRGFP